MEQRALNLKDACAYLGCSQSAFRAVKNAGHIHPIPLLNSYDKKELDQLVESLKLSRYEHTTTPHGEMGSEADRKNAAIVKASLRLGSNKRGSRRKPEADGGSEPPQTEPEANVIHVHGSELHPNGGKQVGEMEGTN